MIHPDLHPEDHADELHSERERAVILIPHERTGVVRKRHAERFRRTGRGGHSPSVRGWWEIGYFHGHINGNRLVDVVGHDKHSRIRTEISVDMGGRGVLTGRRERTTVAEIPLVGEDVLVGIDGARGVELDRLAEYTRVRAAGVHIRWCIASPYRTVAEEAGERKTIVQIRSMALRTAVDKGGFKTRLMLGEPHFQFGVIRRRSSAGPNLLVASEAGRRETVVQIRAVALSAFVLYWISGARFVVGESALHFGVIGGRPSAAPDRPVTGEAGRSESVVQIRPMALGAFVG